MRGHVTVLLAQTLWAIGTEEGREAAKTQFLDCITQDPENPTLINALAGMGSLTDYNGLIDAALSEFKSLLLDLHHRSTTRLFVHPETAPSGPGKLTAALSEAQKAVHVEPAREDARRTLVTLLLQCGEPAAARAVINVISQGGANGDIADLRASIGLRAVAGALLMRKV
ncbi:hypothetical protein DFH94DRAFT_728372 [Russula ochroleuca]|uniref:Uncharacterized protein n=1 Tax=Russula ochroleuca TaxID=152965 RepID=A0A9P5MZF6_9AGAM|nr:hypothetical protein DFH94DRAFT_728372 [Russula ochroleuca]